MKEVSFSVLLLGCLLAFSTGIVVGKLELFPYQILKTVKSKIAPTANASSRKRRELVQLFEHFSPKADVAFVGDSITNAGRWSEFFPNLNVVNRGIGGEKASDLVVRLDSIQSSEPSKIFIMLGINDIRQYVEVPTILENYEMAVEGLARENTKVFIQSTIQCDVSVCGIEQVNSVSELNKGLAQLASIEGVEFLSLGDLSETEGLKSKYTTDGVHLSAEGYIYWVKKIEPLLR